MNYAKYKRVARNKEILRWFKWLCEGVEKSEHSRIVTYIWPYLPKDELRLNLVRRYLNATIDMYEKPSLATCFRDIMVRITITK